MLLKALYVLPSLVGNSATLALADRLVALDPLNAVAHGPWRLKVGGKQTLAFDHLNGRKLGSIAGSNAKHPVADA